MLTSRLSSSKPDGSGSDGGACAGGRPGDTGIAEDHLAPASLRDVHLEVLADPGRVAAEAAAEPHDRQVLVGRVPVPVNTARFDRLLDEPPVAQRPRYCLGPQGLVSLRSDVDAASLGVVGACDDPGATVFQELMSAYAVTGLAAERYEPVYRLDFGRAEQAAESEIGHHRPAEFVVPYPAAGQRVDDGEVAGDGSLQERLPSAPVRQSRLRALLPICRPGICVLPDISSRVRHDDAAAFGLKERPHLADFQSVSSSLMEERYSVPARGPRRGEQQFREPFALMQGVVCDSPLAEQLFNLRETGPDPAESTGEQYAARAIGVELDDAGRSDAPADHVKPAEVHAAGFRRGGVHPSAEGCGNGQESPDFLIAAIGREDLVPCRDNIRQMPGEVLLERGCQRAHACEHRVEDLPPFTRHSKPFTPRGCTHFPFHGLDPVRWQSSCDVALRVQ